MPEIRPYTSQIVAQGAMATPDAFGAPQASATMNLVGAGADVAKILHEQEVQRDVTNIQVQMAKARAEWTVQLRDRANQATPGDQTFAPRLMDDMDKYFTDLSQTAKTTRGQQLFSTLSANMKTDFLARGVAEQAKLAADGAKLNVKELQDASGQTVFQDPTQRQSVLENMSGYIDNLPGIDQATRMALKKGAEDYINHTAVLGQIQRNPDELLARINPKDLEGKDPSRQLRTGDPAFDALPAEDQYKLIKQAREYKVAYEQDDERIRRKTERENKEAREGVMNEFTTRILAPGGQNAPAPTAREIMSNNTLESAQKEHLVRLSWAVERELSEGRASKRHPQNVQRLFSRIVADQDDPQKIMSERDINEEFIKGNLSSPERDWLVRNVRDLRDPDSSPFTKEVNNAINDQAESLKKAIETKAVIMTDSSFYGSVMGRVRTDLTAEIEQYRSEKKNPRDLLNPGSKDYFFTPERIAGYVNQANSAATMARAKVAAEARAATLEVGTVKNGYKFKGGDPANKDNWEKVK